jgi:predicted ATPase
MNDVLLGHDRILRDAIADLDGAIFSTAGDAFGAAFHTAHDALTAAVRVQRQLIGGEWPEGLEPQVRMGIHIGTAFERDNNYFGPTLNRAARLMNAAHGGQVVVSGDFQQSLGQPPEGVSLQSLGTFRLSDISEPVAIWQVAIDGLRVQFPPLDTVGPPPPRVPRYRTSFVGRAQELARLEEVLGRYRLVTLIAAGGTGKTRLAYETAAAVAEQFPDGVFAVEFADGGPEQVETRAAEAVLGEVPLARTERAADPSGALADYLLKRRALLVLDNCEHVMPPARRLINLLNEACPQTAVLATSREVFGLPGEVVVQLKPLSTSPGQGAVSPAAELFVERATLANHDLVLDEQQLAAVELICEQLEGLPLGVELAASRVRMLRPTQILAQLDDAMSLLRRRGRGPERQQSLEGAIWWSWQLLNLEEQALLARSSVFVGGFALDAVQTIGMRSAGDVIDSLESLVDKSLVANEGNRYRLAEPIRQFAGARLEEMDDVEETQTAHFTHFSRLARSVVPDLDTKPEPRLVLALTRDHDNFIAAIERARERGDVTSAARLAVRLHTYWEETGHLSVGAQMLESLVGPAPDDPAVFGAAAVLTTYSVMCGDLARAEELAKPMRLALEADLPTQIAGRIRFNIGFIDIASGKLGDCVELWSRAGADLTDHDAPLARQSFWSAGYSATMAGELDQARDLFDRAEALPVPEGWFPSMVELSRTVVDVLEGKGDVANVEARFDDLDRLGLRFRTLLASVLGGLALFEAGEPKRADRVWRHGLEMAREAGSLWGAFLILELGAWGAYETGDHESAARLWGSLDDFGTTRGYARWAVVDKAAGDRRATAREADTQRFDLALAQGMNMPLHEAVDAALGL